MPEPTVLPTEARGRQAQEQKRFHVQAHTILIVDDHPIVREGLRRVLEGEPDFRIVGEASDGPEALALLESLHPALLILDVALPGMNGIEIAREAAKRAPGTRILILSMYPLLTYVTDALASGVGGYLLKDTDIQNVIPAIRRVLAGERYLSPPLSEQVVEAYARRSREGFLEPYDTLTTRERDVLRLLGEGMSAPEIARQWSLSLRTVEHHRASIMRKLGLANSSQLIAYAVRRKHGVPHV